MADDPQVRTDQGDSARMLQADTTFAQRYVLQALVARGGMGEVWRALDQVLDRTVAIKVLLPEISSDPGFAARFRAEARAMAALSDPSIVEIYDYGQTDGITYLVMPFVDGESLASLIHRSGAQEPARAMGLLAQAAEALQVAHARGIVHRDVKPGNLLLRRDDRLVLSDFGIARIVAADRLTAAGDVIGTAAYLAPEQVTNSAITPATDVYALGVVGYELLTGRRPFTAHTSMAVALKHTQERPPPLPADVPAAVRQVVMRALEKDPSHRWPSAQDMARAARAAAGLANPTATANPDRRRRRLLVGVAAVLLAVGLVATGLTLTRPDIQDPAEAAGSAMARAESTVGPVVAGSTEPARGPSPSGAAATPTQSAVGATGTSTAAVGPATTTPVGATPSTPSGPRTVPALRYFTEDEAIGALTALDLRPHVVYKVVAGRCNVVSQTPDAGTVVAAGSTVELTVANPVGGTCQIT